eukprot:gene35461-43723_t
MSEKKSSSGEKLLYCSFCGKSQHEVKKLIAGPSVFICDECIDLCNDIIRDETSSIESVTGAKSDLPTQLDVILLAQVLQTLVVVVHRNRQDALGGLLADDVLVQQFLDF